MKKHLLIIVSALVSVLSLNLIAVTATEPTVKNIYYDDGVFLFRRNVQSG